jgi:hypothetical protein
MKPMNSLSSLAFLVPLLLPLSAQANDYVPDIDGRCALWAPSMLHQREYAVRYTGACRNGRAEGRGTAEWLYRYAEMKVKASWRGEFRNGVFLDGQEIKGWVEPVPGDRYVVAMGKLDGAGLYFISRSPQDGPLALCRIDRVALVLGPSADAGDDEAVRRLMEDGARFYLAACPRESRTPSVGAFTEAIAAQPNGLLPEPFARARYDADSGKLSAYRNDVADQAGEARKRAAFMKAQDEARARFNEFSLRNGIAAWVTTRQLDENPFRWEGRTVGVIVRLERMLAPDAALVQSGLRDGGRAVQLAGITPDFPESRHSVLAAVRVGTRQPAADGGDARIAYTTLHHVDSRVCASDGCGDWLLWARGERRLAWGEPFSPR